MILRLLTFLLAPILRWKVQRERAELAAAVMTGRFCVASFYCVECNGSGRLGVRIGWYEIPLPDPLFCTSCEGSGFSDLSPTQQIFGMRLCGEKENPRQHGQ